MRVVRAAARKCDDAPEAWRQAMNKIGSSEQINHRRRHFFGAATLTVTAARLAMIIAAATLAITSSALARQSAAQLKGFYAPAAAPQTRTTVDRNDPALTGGGSLGYNQRVEQGF
jgi:hypothetical protein